jgi:hypothetical protein
MKARYWCPEHGLTTVELAGPIPTLKIPFASWPRSYVRVFQPATHQPDPDTFIDYVSSGTEWLQPPLRLKGSPDAD